MDVIKIARKLQPLMPKQVERWLRVRDTADSELREMIDRQIVSTAHRKLGDFRRKILLSLPPQKKAGGSFSLGTVLYDTPKWPLGLSRAELLQNLAIFGRSGSGKTNVAFLLLEQLTAKRIPWLFLDWKRTARHMIPRLKGKVRLYTPGRSLSPFPFNPFIPPPGLEYPVYVNHVIDVLADAYTLGDGARSVLQKALIACHQRDHRPPTVSELLEEVNSVPDKQRVRGWKITTIRVLESLAFSNITADETVTQESLVNTLLEGNTIIELDALSQAGKQFLAPLLCLWLYYVKLAQVRREKLDLVIFVEEAHHLLYRTHQRSKETLMEMLLRQCREIGIAMIVVDQHPHLISSAVLGNVYASICLNQKDPSDITRAAGLSGLDEDEKRHLTMLPVGQGIVKLQDRWRSPMLVQFPLVEVKKGSVTDDRLARFLRRNTNGTGRIRAVDGEFNGDRGVSLAGEGLSNEAFVFLEDVLRHPDDGVKARYLRLGMSVRRGMAVRDALLHSGMLERETVKIGRTRKVLLRLRRQARELLGIDTGKAVTRESLAHEFWKNFYARRFQNEGYRVQVEARRNGGRVDVLAVKGAVRVGIEVETGKSDVVANVKANLRAGFDRILVVATDEKALQKVERQLAEAGLLISGRVEVVLRERSELR